MNPPGKQAGEKSRKSGATLRERLEALYGPLDEDLVRAIRLRDMWATSVFSMTEKQITEQRALNTSRFENIEHAKPIPNSLFSPTQVAPEGTLPALNPCVVNDYLLNPHETRQCEVSVILNTGGSVLCMDWGADFLAVSVVAGQRPLDLSAVDDLLYGRLVILFYSFKNGQVELVKTITGECGLAKSLKFRPGSNELLVLCGNDGLGIVDVGKAPNGYSELALVDIQHMLREDLGCPTSICWRTPNAVSVGYFSGYVAELQVGAVDNTVVNFVVRAHDSVIAQLASAYPLRPDLLLTSGVDGFVKLLNTSHLGDRRQCPRNKLHSPLCVFSLLTDSFVATQDPDVVKLVPIRDPGMEIEVARHAGYAVVSGATHRDHPFLVSGTQSGSVWLVNALRRATTPPRKARASGSELEVWRLECSEHDGKFRYVEVLRQAEPRPAKNGRTSMRVFPTSVAITSCGWSPTEPWFCAASAAGLIRFDNLDA